MEKTLVVFKKGFNYSNDGAGNRLVYHLSGCNMRCPWCSNPEGLTVSFGREYTLSQIKEEIKSSKMLFFDGGGVTFTGGEPTLQFEALFELFRDLKAEGINTALETNGTSARLCELFPYLDQLMCDIKHPDNDECKKITKIENATTLENIRSACDFGLRADIRIPLVNGYNCDEKSISGFCDFFSSLPADKYTLELLRYHEYGKVKYEKCGLEYKVSGGYVSDELFVKIVNEFKKHNINLIRT